MSGTVAGLKNVIMMCVLERQICKHCAAASNCLVHLHEHKAAIRMGFSGIFIKSSNHITILYENILQSSKRGQVQRNIICHENVLVQMKD